MRIGLNGRFYGAPVTGVQRFARGVAACLAEMADVRLLLPRGIEPDDGGDGTPRVRGTLRGHAWEQLELPWRARAEGCDVVLHPANTAPVFGGPHVVVVHDATPLTHPEWFTPAFSLWYQAVVARAVRRAARVATGSQTARGEVARAFGLAPSRIAVVPHALEPFSAPSDPESVRRVRQRYGLPERYLLAVGAGDPRKRLDFLAEVLARLEDEGDVVPPLVIVGDAQARIHGSAPVPAGARHVGRVSDEDLRALYTGATAFCHPSADEGFGRPPLEAIACGAPAIVADYAAADEVLGDAALIVPREIDRWMAALREVLVRPHEVRGRGRVPQVNPTWRSTARDLLALCAEVAGMEGGRPCA